MKLKDRIQQRIDELQALRKEYYDVYPPQGFTGDSANVFANIGNHIKELQSVLYQLSIGKARLPQMRYMVIETYDYLGDVIDYIDILRYHIGAHSIVIPISDKRWLKGLKNRQLGELITQSRNKKLNPKKKKRPQKYVYEKRADGYHFIFGSLDIEPDKI